MSISPEAMDANLVLTLDEITSLTQDGGKPADTLMNVVALIASRFRTDVCSAYLLEPDRSNLVLAASLGLHSRSIGALRPGLRPTWYRRRRLCSAICIMLHHDCFVRSSVSAA